jgi:hypothetical protein
MLPLAKYESEKYYANSIFAATHEFYCIKSILESVQTKSERQLDIFTLKIHRLFREALGRKLYG